MSASAPPPDAPATGVRVLVVDDEPRLRRSIARMLASRGLRGRERRRRPRRPRTPAASRRRRRARRSDDAEHGRPRGARAREGEAPPREIIMMTAFADVESAVGAVKPGAYHFLTKPFQSNDAIALTVAKAAEHKRLLERTRCARRAPRAARAVRRDHRHVAEDAGGLSPHRGRRDRDLHGARPRRERHRQGARRARHPPALAAREQAVRRRQLRAPSPRSSSRASSSATCKRRVHRRARRARGALRGGRRRHALPRRGRRSPARRAGEAPPRRSRRARSSASARTRHAPSTCASSRRRTSISRSESPPGTFREDLFYRLNVIAISLPAAARARRTTSLLLAYHFLQKYARRMGRDVQAHRARRARRAPRARLAGQRARARARDRARGGARARRPIISPRDLPLGRGRATERPPAMSRAPRRRPPSCGSAVRRSEAARARALRRGVRRGGPAPRARQRVARPRGKRRARPVQLPADVRKGKSADPPA